jgi:hypothetical protein
MKIPVHFVALDKGVLARLQTATTARSVVMTLAENFFGSLQQQHQQSCTGSICRAVTI